MGDKNVSPLKCIQERWGGNGERDNTSVSFYLKGKEKWSGSGEQYRAKESYFISSLQHAFMLIGLIQEKRKYW